MRIQVLHDRSGRIVAAGVTPAGVRVALPRKARHGLQVSGLRWQTWITQTTMRAFVK